MDYSVIRLRWRASRSSGSSKGHPICTLSVSEDVAETDKEIISVMGVPGTEDMIRGFALSLWVGSQLGDAAKKYLMENGTTVEAVKKLLSEHGINMKLLVQENNIEVYLLTPVDQ